MISDVDEIPDPKKINEFDVKNKYACFLQKNFQSKINLLNITENYWPGTKICQKNLTFYVLMMMLKLLNY